jgi:hypothetical protein
MGEGIGIMQTMRDMLRNTLGRSLSAMPVVDRLAAAWPVACGVTLAAHGDVVHYEDGVVTVRVVDAQWLGPLEHNRAVLASDLARIARVPVSAIHFEVKPNGSRKF